jgi:hypothetical protein
MPPKAAKPAGAQEPAGPPGSDKDEALTGDGAPRDEVAPEAQPGAVPPEAPEATAPDDEAQAPAHPEPTPVPGAHLVQDNVSWQNSDDDVPPEERSQLKEATGVTEQDNVNHDGEQHTRYADGSSSVHTAPSEPSAPAGNPLDPQLERGALDPD